MSVVSQAVKSVLPGAHKEDRVTKLIENQTGRIPSTLFLAAALGSIGASLAFMATGKKNTANFVGQWAPVFLILGLYNKLVKQSGHN